MYTHFLRDNTRDGRFRGRENTGDLKFCTICTDQRSVFTKSNDGSGDNNPFNWRPDQIQAQWD